MSKPTYIAYVVNEAKDDPEGKGYWRSVGAVWPHSKGDGFDVVIHDQISVTGRIVCRAPKDKPAEASA